MVKKHCTTCRCYAGEPKDVRVPTLSSWKPRIPAGTVAWSEHERAAETYALRWGGHFDPAGIARAGGFSYLELRDLLGGEPITWRSR